ncbi:tetratricopeptide repeat protein [Kitasatospora sp. NPDC048540]|uniref:tetratricopeptide repeat protein n=1 Tax=Kitasatospora sp. NPDC048540 TaxID=3155634 RepID=UPI0033C034ED
MGNSLGASGQVTATTEYQQRLAATTRDRLGPFHPDTLVTYSILARWQGESGDATGAATSLAGILAAMQRLVGPNHPDTLAVRGSLAFWRGEARLARPPPTATF